MPISTKIEALLSFLKHISITSEVNHENVIPGVELVMKMLREYKNKHRAKPAGKFSQQTRTKTSSWRRL